MFKSRRAYLLHKGLRRLDAAAHEVSAGVGFLAYPAWAAESTICPGKRPARGAESTRKSAGTIRRAAGGRQH